jgi:4-amino-4-deoxy-L-arabinose transferase
VNQRRAGAALAVLFAVFYLAMLGIRPLARPDEFRNAEIAREMVASGDWVTPRLNGVRYFEKPVLGHWLNALSISAFGENAFAARLAGALATGLTALFLAVFARRAFPDRRHAFDPAWIQLSFVAVWGIGTIGSLDPILTLWLTLAIGLYYLSLAATSAAQRRRRLALVGVCCGLAFLTKGFLALAIPVLIAVPLLIWQRDWARLRSDAWLPMLTAVLVVLPWGLSIHLREPDFWRYFFWEEHVRRFFTDSAQHRRPVWLFIALLPAMALPWTAYWPAALSGLQRSTLEPRLLRFLALWLGMPLLFFSASRGKLLPYILPCFPPLALLLAHGLACYRHAGRTTALRAGAIGLAVLFVAGVAGLLLNRFGVAGPPLFSALESGRWALCVTACVWGAFAAGVAAWRSGGRRAWILGSTVLGIFLVAPFAVPQATRDSTMPVEFLTAERARIAPDAVLVASGGLAASVAWVFQRSDVHVVDPGELRYGLSQPDAAGRKLDARGIGSLVRANAGRHDVVILTWTDDEARLAPFVPAVTRRARSGDLLLWHIPASLAP